MKKIQAIKKIICVIFFIIVAHFICESTPYYINTVDYGDKIRIVVNDTEETNNLPDKVIIQNDEVLLSLATVKKYIDSGIYNTKNSVKINHDKYLVTMPISSNIIMINTTEKIMNVPTSFISGDESIEISGDVKNYYSGDVTRKIYIPVKALEEIYDIEVEYNNKVIISTSERYNYSKGTLAKNTKLKKFKREKSATVSKMKKNEEIIILTEAFETLSPEEYVYIRTVKGELGFVRKNKLKLKEIQNRVIINDIEESRRIPDEIKIIDNKIMLSFETIQRFINKYIYLDDSNTIIAIENDKIVKLPINEKNIIINDITKQIEVPAQYIDEVLYVPIEELAEVYQLQIDNDEIIRISENKQMNLATIDDEKKISLVWEYAENYTPDRSSESKKDAINVVSPTWIYSSDEFGAVKDKTSESYIAWAKKNGYEIWPTVKNDYLGIEKTSLLVTDIESRKCFIDNIVELCEKYKFDGINLDFEHMYQRDRDEYVILVRELSAMLNQKGIISSVDVNVPDGSSEWSLCYDSKAISDSCDYVIVMAYDQYGRSSSVAGPVAGLNWVEKNLKKMIERDLIDNNKLVLGVPFYSRQWKLQNGSVYNTTALSMSAAETQMENKKNDTEWNEELGQYVVNYNTNGSEIIIYIENEDSLKEKLKLIEKYDLAGVAAWRRGFETNEVWQVIEENIN